MALLKNMRRRHPSAGLILDIVSFSTEIAHPVERSRSVGHLAGAPVERVPVVPQVDVVSAKPTPAPLRLVTSEPSPWDVEAEPPAPVALQVVEPEPEIEPEIEPEHEPGAVEDEEVL